VPVGAEVLPARKRVARAVPGAVLGPERGSVYLPVYPSARERSQPREPWPVGREMYETWYKMIAMLQTGLDVTPVLTHRFPIAEFQRGFDVMRSGQSGKVVLEWEGA